MSGVRVASYAIAILYVAACWLASSVDFVVARFVDQAALPLCALVGLALAVLVPLPKITWRLVLWIGATGLFMPLVI